MRTLLAILLLIPVAAIKIVLVLLGVIVVPLTFQRGLPSLYRIGVGRPHTMWEAIVRNPVGGFGWLITHPATYATYGAVQEPHLTTARFQWRLRNYRWLSSLRLVWKYSDTRYGELYVGWKLGSAPPELDLALSVRLWATVGN